MRRLVLMIVAWTARFGVWLLLLALAVHIVLNHRGISVRGRLAQLWLPTERQQAMRALIEPGGLAHLLPPAAELEPVPLGWGIQFLLDPGPAVFALAVQSPVGEWDQIVVVTFDQEGRVVGAPIIDRAENQSFAYGQPFQVLKARDDHFVLFRRWDQLTKPAPTTGPTNWDLYFHVFRLAGTESTAVFALHCACSRTQWFTLEGTHPDREGVAVELKRAPTTRSVEPPTIAGFVWDQNLGRFVGPQSDPQGRWEVILPEPDPPSDTAE